MPKPPPQEILQRVTTTHSRLIADWREGVSLEQRSKLSIEQLCDRVTADRMSLARDCRRRARVLQGLEPPMFRDAISRHYYCIYHAFRAVSFFVTRGDDFDDHATLPKGIPQDFPDSDRWRNDLKLARLTRNNADYNAYPKSELAWRADCELVATLSEAALPAAKRYLIQRGCHLT